MKDKWVPWWWSPAKKISSSTLSRWIRNGLLVEGEHYKHAPYDKMITNIVWINRELVTVEFVELHYAKTKRKGKHSSALSKPQLKRLRIKYADAGLTEVPKYLRADCKKFNLPVVL